MFIRSSVGGVFACMAVCAISASGAAVAQNGAALPSGASITITAERHDGAEAIDISGRARPWSILVITERAKLSRDLPIVTLNRVSLKADSRGSFSAKLSLASDFVPTSEVYVDASDALGTIGTVAFTVGRLTNGPPIPLADNRDYQEYH